MRNIYIWPGERWALLDTLRIIEYLPDVSAQICEQNSMMTIMMMVLVVTVVVVAAVMIMVVVEGEMIMMHFGSHG